MQAAPPPGRAVTGPADGPGTAPSASCRACGSRALSPIVKVGRVPVFCNVLWPDREEALAAPMGDIDLALCTACGLVDNLAFDPGLVVYSPAYHNSLEGSPTFRAFAEELARRLVADYDLHGRDVVEIGAGDGEFLARVCELGGNRGTGFDPSAGPDATAHKAIAGSAFPQRGERLRADFVLCRHVLEHVADPGGLLSAIRRALGDRGYACYFEVPDATYMLERDAVWDLIYEHCAYFSEPPLRSLFAHGGFDVVAAGRAYADQFLWLEATPREGAAPDDGAAPGLERLASLAAGFGDRFRAKVAQWEERLPALASDGPVAVWGSGSKGVSFLNLVRAAGQVTWVVDVNPRKHGLYVPGTGHEVVPPDRLAPDAAHVIVMNPVYSEEIGRMLRELGSDAAVVTP